MDRAVFDANVWVRAAISKTGAAGYLIDALRQGQVEVVTSHHILEETFDVLRRRHIQRRRKLSHEQKRRMITVMTKYGILVRPSKIVDVVSHDPDDNLVIAAALEGESGYIVSGDNHLLSLKHYQGIQIVDPETFARILRVERSRKP